MARKGFTLIELLVTIMILGVLSLLISGNFLTSLKKGRDARRKADLEQIQRALEMYYEDNRAYPLSLTADSQLSDAESGKIYMVKVPDDPIRSQNYGYEPETNGENYRLYACLENNLQIIPYESAPDDFECATLCKNQAGNNVECIWGISSSNTNP